MKTLISSTAALLLFVTACSGSDTADGNTTTAEEATTTTEQMSSTTEEVSTTDPDPCETIPVAGSTFSLSGGGLDHEVQLYVPTSFDGSPLPVVLNWHGLGSDGSGQASLTAYESLAQAEGFMVVHPTGVPAAGDTRNSWELAQFDTPDRDDVEFAETLIDKLVSSYCADPTRIYSTGMSNGGFFTSRLVCELSDRIAAAASIGGTTHPDDCLPQRPVPYLSFHGTADDVVGFNGGGSTLISGEQPEEVAAFFDQVMPDEFAEFAADFGCTGSETVDIGDEVTRTDYTGCESDVPLSFFTIDEGGHTWPGSPLGPALAGTFGLTTDQVNATTLSWEFFSQFSLS